MKVEKNKKAKSDEIAEGIVKAFWRITRTIFIIIITILAIQFLFIMLGG